MSSEGFRPSHLSLAFLNLTDRQLQMLSGLATDLVELRVVKCRLESVGAVRPFPHLEKLVMEELDDPADGIPHLLAACATASQVHLSGIRSSNPLGSCSFHRLTKLELKNVPIKEGTTLRTLLHTHRQSLIHLNLQALCGTGDEESILWRPFFSCRFPNLRLLHLHSTFALLGLQPALMKRLRIVCPQLLVYINAGDPACPAAVNWPLIVGTRLKRYHLTVAPRKLPSMYREYYAELVES